MERFWRLDVEDPFGDSASGLRPNIGPLALLGGFLVLAGGVATIVSAALGAVAIKKGAEITRQRRQRRWAYRVTRLVPPIGGAALFDARAERHLVRVRGVVRVMRDAAPGVGSDAPCAWRRTEIELDGRERSLRLYHDLAEDFELALPDGRTLGVEVAAARALLLPAGRWSELSAEAVAAAGVTLPPEALQKCGELRKVRVREALVRDGDPVEIVGHLARVLDPAGAAILREPARRTVLTAGWHAVVVAPSSLPSPR